MTTRTPSTSSPLARRLPLVLSIVAVVIAVLGSTPVGNAAKGLVIPRNSVGPAQLKANAVTGLKVKDGSLLAADFRRGQLPQGAVGATGPAGPQGPAGAAGPAGPKGDAGTPATALWARVVSAAVANGQGVLSATLNGAGVYEVRFNRDVSQCALVATPVKLRGTVSASVSSTDQQKVLLYSVDYMNQLSDFSVAAFC